MGRSYTVAGQAERDGTVVDLGDQLAALLPSLAEVFTQRSGSVVVRGLSITQGNGRGWLATLKLTCTEVAVQQDGTWEKVSGDFVMYGGGASPWEALADLEVKHNLDVVNLVPDKYSQNKGAGRAQLAPGGPQRRKKH